jgi:MFS family permease
MFFLVSAASGIFILALWIPGSGNAINIVFAVLFGFSSGAYVSLSPALVAQISPPKEFGYRNGLMYFFAAFPGLVTNPIAGAILARDHGSYIGMKVFAGVFCLVGATLVLIARLLKTGPRANVNL